MKAAVISDFGQVPTYAEFPDPVCAPGETPVQVLASVLDNFNRVTVAGTHYASQKLFPQFPAIAGTGGVGLTEDGRYVGFGPLKPPYGSFAEKVVAGYVSPIPEGIDPAMAAAIPTSVLTSLLPLKYTARLSPGETVLVNGATGVSGRIAVQVARSLGAVRVVGTGRNPSSLQLLKQWGVDEVIDLGWPDDRLRAAFIAAAGEKGYDVILDFLWGRPAEILISSLIPDAVGFPKRQIRYVQIGQSAGPHIALPGSALRTSGVVLQGIGPIAPEILSREMSSIWEGIKAGKFQMDITRVFLRDISEVWRRDTPAGTRLVIVP